MITIVPILFLFLILGVVLLVDVRTLVAEKNTKLWVVYGLLYSIGSLLTFLYLLGVRLPNLFRLLGPYLIPVSRWLMLR